MKASKLSRPQSKKINDILGKKIKVLDDGFIRVIDYMGNDESIVQAARVSYGEGTKKVHQDRGLIRYLMRHRHTTPFEMCEIKLHVRVPMDCWRQWIRHRTANVNEYSTRYSIAIDAISKTKPNDWRLQSSINKQGSEGHLDIKVGTKLSKQEEKLHSLSREIYEERLNADVAREQARKDLPLSTYTEAYWKIDLHNLLHFLSLRMDDHAQHEIRQYANIIGYEIVSKWVPFTWEAFLDYQFISVFFSESETSLLKLIYSGKIDELIHMMEQSGWLKKQDNFWKLNREGSEFAEKLEKIGIKSPWNKQ